MAKKTEREVTNAENDQARLTTLLDTIDAGLSQLESASRDMVLEVEKIHAMLNTIRQVPHNSNKVITRSNDSKRKMKRILSRLHDDVSDFLSAYRGIR